MKLASHVDRHPPSNPVRIHAKDAAMAATASLSLLVFLHPICSNNMSDWVEFKVTSDMKFTATLCATSNSRCDKSTCNGEHIIYP